MEPVIRIKPANEMVHNARHVISHLWEQAFADLLCRDFASGQNPSVRGDLTMTRWIFGSDQCFQGAGLRKVSSYDKKERHRKNLSKWIRQTLSLLGNDSHRRAAQ